MTRQVNLVRSKVRQRMMTRLAESSGRPLERHGNVSPREMAVEGAKNPGTEPGVQVGPFAFILLTGIFLVEHGGESAESPQELISELRSPYGSAIRRR